MSSKLQFWRGGWYIEINQKEPKQDVWICARPPGELVLGHWSEESHVQICERLSAGRKEIAGEECQLAVVLTAEEASELQSRNDAAAVQSRAVAVFRTYFEIAGA
ncbi:MAG: hypothetical protein U0441_14570 [Polyangiaceae bacterium]